MKAICLFKLAGISTIFQFFMMHELDNIIMLVVNDFDFG